MNTPVFFKSRPILPGFTLSFGLSVFFISLVILLPLAALLLKASSLSWAEYWSIISHPRVVASYKVTLLAAFVAAVINVVIGLLLAWILERYEFWGRHLLDGLVDLPFALPTAVAGLTLSALFAGNGWIGQFLEPLGIKVAYAFPGIVLAMVFTSIPFVVRTVQPVIAELGTDVEEAARLLGASRSQIWWKIVFPYLRPALLTGAALSFIRSLGEFGAVIFIAGNLPFETEITSLMIFVRIQEYQVEAATAIASVVLLTSLILLFGVQWLQARWAAKGGRS